MVTYVDNGLNLILRSQIDLKDPESGIFLQERNFILFLVN